MKKCTISNCDQVQKYTGKGLCRRHYQRAWEYGRLELERIIGDDEARFWSKVNKTDACWLWSGTTNPDSGYGRFQVTDKNSRKSLYAHRYSYELAKGKIAPKLVIDHLCRVPACVNPSHLEAVTNRENGIRGNVILNKKSKLPVGVRKHYNKFKAQIQINGVTHYLGSHETVESASRAYNLAREGR